MTDWRFCGRNRPAPTPRIYISRIYTTGSNTILGAEPQFSNYLTLLAKCHLNVTTTKDCAILPACVPNLVPSLVLANFTESQHSDFLNDTKFTGAGIGSEDNWVVVLSTNTPGGSFAAADNSVGLVSKVGLIWQWMSLVMSFFFLL